MSPSTPETAVGVGTVIVARLEKWDGDLPAEGPRPEPVEVVDIVCDARGGLVRAPHSATAEVVRPVKGV